MLSVPSLLFETVLVMKVEGKGSPFYGACRYMHWMLTVPFLLMDIVLVMKLEGKDASNQRMALGASAALIIIWFYLAELVVEGDSGQRGFFIGYGPAALLAHHLRVFGGVFC